MKHGLERGDLSWPRNLTTWSEQGRRCRPQSGSGLRLLRPLRRAYGVELSCPAFCDVLT